MDKKYYHVLVFRYDGCVFVTDVDYNHNEIEINGEKKPISFETEEGAKFVVDKCKRAGDMAVVIVSDFPINYQPYDYGAGYFQWHCFILPEDRDNLDIPD